MFKILLLLALTSCAKLNLNGLKEKSGKKPDFPEFDYNFNNESKEPTKTYNPQTGAESTAFHLTPNVAFTVGHDGKGNPEVGVSVTVSLKNKQK